MIAEGAYPVLGPAVVAAGRLAGPVQDGCDGLIRHQPRRLSDEHLRLLVGRPAVFAARILLHLERRVVAALPVQDKVDIAVRNAHHDLVEHCANDPLAGRHRSRGTRPSLLEIGAKLHEPHGGQDSERNVGGVGVTRKLAAVPHLDEPVLDLPAPRLEPDFMPSRPTGGYNAASRHERRRRKWRRVRRTARLDRGGRPHDAFSDDSRTPIRAALQ
jgi:hypothetical protein